MCKRLLLWIFQELQHEQKEQRDGLHPELREFPEHLEIIQMPKMMASQDLQMLSFLRRWSVSTEAVIGAHLPGLFCPDWSPVWLIPVRVTPSAAFFFSLRLRVRFRSADHSWARDHQKKMGGSFLRNHSGPKYQLSQPLPTPCNCNT